MSILIKGAKMPRCCEVCPLNYDYYRCEALGDRFDDREEIDMETQRLPDCPLVEIPPHGRLIDADVFEEMLNSKGGVKLKDMPTVIESEEQEHE